MYGFVLLTLPGAYRMAVADPVTTVYAIRGPGTTLIWRSGDASNTEVLLFAFSNLAPQQGTTPAPGPRVTFSVTRTTVENGAPVRRQWYGDSVLEAKALAIGGDLGEAVLDANVGGTLVEQRGSGVTVTRDMPGRLQIRWTATGPNASVTTAFVQQASPYAVMLQAVGPGRTAMLTGTLTIAAMGAPLTIAAPGTLVAPSSGLLTTTLE
jgi:hypothetical protein